MRDALTQALLSRESRGADYGLERMQRALAALDHPERGLQVVHVAGTNGKGSVCAMVEAIARAAGLSTGMFTSPHLSRLEERIRIDGQPIAPAPFASALEQALTDPALTFFEAMTAAALCAMRTARVDLAILEVGLGGRLDATNAVADTLVSAIVTIGRDHMRLLGDDDASIAREKAGILRPGTPLVVGALGPRACAAVHDAAHRVGAAPVWTVGEDIQVDLPLSVTTPDGHVDGLRLSLDGAHQQHNAAVACGIAWLLGRAGKIADVPAALREGLPRAHWAGRLERIARDGCTVLLDCAHNEPAARALAHSLDGHEPARTRLVFGAMGDKSWREMLALLGPLAHARYYCPPLTAPPAGMAGRLPAAPDALAAVAPGSVHASATEAIGHAMADARPGDTIVVTGSIFLVGAVRAELLGLPPAMAIPL